MFVAVTYHVPPSTSEIIGPILMFYESIIVMGYPRVYPVKSHVMMLSEIDSSLGNSIVIVEP